MQETAHPVSALMFGTLIVVAVIAIIILARFLRKPKNRHPMDGQRERNIDEIQRDGPTDGPVDGTSP